MKFLKLDYSLKKILLFLTTIIFAMIASSCSEKPPEQIPPSAQNQPRIYTSPDDGNLIFTISLNDTTEMLKMGRNLLEEYDVQYNQTIRFPYKDIIFETHGAYAITSVKEANNKSRKSIFENPEK